MKLFIDINGNVTQIIPINQANTIILNGAEACEESSVFDYTFDTAVRVATGESRVYIAIGDEKTLTADETCILLPPLSVEWFVIPAGQHIAVLGGAANITKA